MTIKREDIFIKEWEISIGERTKRRKPISAGHSHTHIYIYQIE